MRRMMAGGLVVAGLTVFGGWSQAARAEVGDVGGVVTDYDTYPAALPEQCPDGAGALAGVLFTNEAGHSTDDLADLALGGGETVTMSWDGAVDGCAAPDGQPAVAVTLAAHAVQTTDWFDPMEDQPLLTSASCGGGGQPCSQVDGRYQLALVLPSGAVACSAQVDAVLGPPLGMVGPSGSYYSGALRADGGPTLLVAAGMARTAVCDEDSAPPETPPTTTTPPTTPPNTPPPPGDLPSPPRPPADTSTPPANPEGGPTPTAGPETSPDTAPIAGPQVGSENATARPDQAAALTSPPAASTPAPVAAAPASVAPTRTSVVSPAAAVRSPAVPSAGTSVLGITANRADLPTTGARTDELVLAAAGFIAFGAVLSVLGSRRERDRALNA